MGSSMNPSKRAQAAPSRPVLGREPESSRREGRPPGDPAPFAGPPPCNASGRHSGSDLSASFAPRGAVEPGDRPCGASRAGGPTAAGMPTHGVQTTVLPANAPCPPTRLRGGPNTPEGKRRSRGNALKHGMYAKKLLPEVLGHECVDGKIRDYLEEFNPQTPVEEHYVKAMARHAAALEQLGEIEGAVLRKGAVGALAVSQCLGSDCGLGRASGRTGWTEEDIMLAGAAGGNDLDRVTRARRAHERGMKEAQQQFEAHRQHRLAAAGPAAPGPFPPPAGAACVASDGATERLAATRFPDEDACAEYLAEWARRQPFRCPDCQHDRAKWIAVRECKESRWQCSNCRRQVRMRHGTVLAESHLPLRTLFLAIECLLLHPDATNAEVAEAAGIRRRGTAGRIAKKIRGALGSPGASRCLAGLDAVFLEAAIRPPPTFGANPVGPLDAAPVTGAVARPGAAPVTESPETPPGPALRGDDLRQSFPANMGQA